MSFDSSRFGTENSFDIFTFKIKKQAHTHERNSNTDDRKSVNKKKNYRDDSENIHGELRRERYIYRWKANKITIIRV